MQKIIGALFVLLFMLAFTSVSHAEVIDELSVENGQLVVREAKVTTIKIEKERYAMPPFAVPEKDWPAVRSIMKLGKGEYVLEQGAKTEWTWGLPMQRRTRQSTATVVFANGSWSEPEFNIEPVRMKDSWGSTILLGAVLLGMIAASLAYKGHGKTDRELCSFYAHAASVAAVIFMGGFYSANVSAAFLSTAIIIGFGIFGFVVLGFLVGGDNRLRTLLVIICGVALIAAFTSYFSLINQQQGAAIFLMATIGISYLLTKLAERAGWITPKLPAR